MTLLLEHLAKRVRGPQTPPRHLPSSNEHIEVGAVDPQRVAHPFIRSDQDYRVSLDTGAKVGSDEVAARRSDLARELVELALLGCISGPLNQGEAS
jgi:hypothetical protein